MRKMAAEEDEPGIPRAALNRVIRETLPNARMSNDFRDVLHLCCMQFIKHVGAEANRLCMNDQKKTINKDHLFRAVQNLGFGPDYLDAGRSVLDLCDEEASRRLKRQNSRLEKCGIPEEELLKLQQQLFDKARTEQASANQLQTAWFQQQWQESMRQKQLMPPPPLPPPVKPSLAAAAVAAATVSSSPPPPPLPSLPHAASSLPSSSSSSSSSPSSSVLVTSTYSSSQSTFAPLNSNSTLTTSAYSSSTSAPTISTSAVLQSVSKMNHKIWEMQNNNDADDDYDAA